MNTVYTRIYEEPPVRREEILRYLGVKETTKEFLNLVEECLKQAESTLLYKVCFCEFDIKANPDEINLGFTRVKSENLKTNLQGCEKIVLFAATVGSGIDRLISKYSATSPAKALVFQAIGTERVESLCNLFNDEIKSEKLKEGYQIKPRFSPGYGDLPIEMQRSVVITLDTQRKIGVTLNESLLMYPTKSVTAIIGLKKRA